MKALLVDDEPLARRELRRLLGAHPDVEVVGEAGGVDEALRAVDDVAPDLIFLDIHMPRRGGFELLEGLEDAPAVVFTTAHDAHALRAFEVGALDYLLKPISPPRLAAALERVRARHSGRERGFAPADRPILVRDGDEAWYVRLGDVELFEAVGNYAQLHFRGHKPLLLRSLQHLESRLDPDHFYRASRQYIVNLAFVERFETGVRGELVAHLKNGRSVAFSRRRSTDFRRRASL